MTNENLEGSDSKNAQVNSPESREPIHRPVYEAHKVIPDALPHEISKLRHPLEWPAYVVAVLLLPALFVGFYFIEPELTSIALGLLVIFVIYREIMRRNEQADDILLSREQFPELYAIVDSHSARLGLNPTPEIFVKNGQGITNAFSTEAWRKRYIVLNSELFANQDESLRDGLDWIIAHELGHIRLKHTNLLYNALLTPWRALERFPVLSIPMNVLSRFREYSADRVGASLSPNGVNGILLLAAGRYAWERVDLGTYFAQSLSGETRGRWTGIAELLVDHPFNANRVRSLYELGFWQDAPEWDEEVSKAA